LSAQRNFQEAPIKTRLNAPIAALALSILAGACGPARAGVLLSTDKDVYLAYEPIYLEIAPDERGFAAKGNPLETGALALQIFPPDGPPYLFKSPITVCLTANAVAERDKGYVQTLILSGSRIITARPGPYGLRMLDAQGDQMGPGIQVQVQAPETPDDIAAMALIAAHPSSYAAFLYLEGGDHLTAGLSVFTRLAEGKSAYAPMARGILAINYSQSFALSAGGRPRGREYARMEGYFLGAFDEVNDVLRAKMVERSMREFGAKGQSPQVLTRVNNFRKWLAGNPELLRNQSFRAASED